MTGQTYSPGKASRLHHLVEQWRDATPEVCAFKDFDGANVTWREIDEKTNAAAEHLASAGVSAGDRVMLVCENSVSVVTFMMAISKLDAWCVPVNARMTAHEIAHIRKHSEPRCMIFTSDCSPPAGDHGRQAYAKECNEEFGCVMIAMTEGGLPEDCHAPACEQVSTLIYTTGTTGAPKAVMLTHENLLSVGFLSAQIRNLAQSDRIYLALPLPHVFGLGSILMASLTVGASIALAPRFDPQAALKALQTDVTIFPAVPQMHAVLMQAARDNGAKKLASPVLRYISSGGAPLDPDWKARCENFFDLPLMNGYGMTEASGTVSSTWRQKNPANVNVGHALPGVEIALGPDHGEPGIGEVLVKGPNVMKGYYKNPEATAAAFDEQGYYRSGDLGHFTESGALMLVGRTKELIIRSGFNVYPLEVEVSLNQHPDVVQAAVVGRKVEGENEEVIAFVQPATGSNIDEDGLKAFLKDRLSPYKRPSRIIVSNSLPAAATGKILKHKLLAHFAEQLETKTN